MSTTTTRNPTLTLLIGLPGAGKSTRAAHMQNEDRNSVIVARDPIRDMLGGKVDEELVTTMMIALAAVAVHSGGKNVIVDDLNLDNPTIQRWVQGFQKKCNIQFERLDTPIEVCIERDAKRPRSVGAEVIKQYATEYL